MIRMLSKATAITRRRKATFSPNREEEDECIAGGLPEEDRMRYGRAYILRSASAYAR
jgi:hypothetical protein